MDNQDDNMQNDEERQIHSMNTMDVNSRI
jgi:hypothetical protein